MVVVVTAANAVVVAVADAEFYQMCCSLNENGHRNKVSQQTFAMKSFWQ